MTDKISIRFFDDREVRAIWDDIHSKWWFSVLDVVAILTDQDDYRKTRNYWKYLKAKLKKENNQVVSKTTQLKILAPDGKKRLSDMLDNDWIILLGKTFPGTKANRFIDWFTYSDDSIDGQSKLKAYALYESSLVDQIPVGTIKWLQQIHAYLFGWLYDFAGTIRQKNISKWWFQFANAQFLDTTLKRIERMPEDTLEQIINKYVEMNIAHPFMEGNGRSARIWLDLILKKRLARCVDWSQISKNDYMNAMIQSPRTSIVILNLIQHALTDDIHSREMFMKWIDYSYYYEEEDIIIS